MARIDTAERLLEVKLVYYGPALCGKTTNLQTLHTFLDPKRDVELMSLDTKGDRTLFFDLLPIDLGEFQGFRLMLRLFTVPGQVHYNATRRIVLRDADGVAFIADSSPGRLAANHESLVSLDENLAADGVKAGTIPIVLQANKRDRPDAASLEAVDESLGLDSLQQHGRAILPGLIPASAMTGEGVFETFEALLRATLAAVFRKYSLSRLGLTREKLGLALYEALAPFRPSPELLEKVAEQAPAVAAPAVAPVAGSPTGAPAPANPWAVEEAHAEDVLAIDDLLAESVEQSLGLAEALGDQRALRTELQRRVDELEAINGLARGLTATVDADEVARLSAEAARAALPDGSASLLLQDEQGRLTERALAGLDSDPLLSCGHPPLAGTLLRAGRPAHYADVDSELVFGDPALLSELHPFRTLAVAPFAGPEEAKGLLVAYGRDADTPAGPDTTRYLVAVAAQASLALQNARRHERLLQHQEHLQEEVDARTAELRVAHQEVMATSGLKDRVLSCVNHELRTPVTKLLSAAQVLERVKPGTSPPPSFMANLAKHARGLAGLLDQVLSAQALLSPKDSGDEEATEIDVVQTLEAVTFTHHERAAERKVVLRVDAPSQPVLVEAQAGSLTLILSQLVDNAVKFTKEGTEVRLQVLAETGRPVRVLVHDGGPGVAAGDVERIFDEFDQGASDALVAKPDGLGLGLSIARRLARRLGGDVSVVGAGESKGATFALELPALKVLTATPIG